uniref:Uncharacterized protein n=1 Tax=Plectus sambesii TaxID=2011161 RepID=A0A914WKH0_9BILA
MAACSLAINYPTDMLQKPSNLVRGEQIADTMVRLPCLLPSSLLRLSLRFASSSVACVLVNFDEFGDATVRASCRVIADRLTSEARSADRFSRLRTAADLPTALKDADCHCAPQYATLRVFLPPLDADLYDRPTDC